MRFRVLLTAAALVLTAPAYATASGESACVHVLTHRAGDTDASRSPALGADDIDALDLVAVDLGTSSTKVVVAFQVRHLAVGGTALDNRQWWAFFSGTHQDFQFVAAADPSGSTAQLSARTPGPVLDSQLANPQSISAQLAFNAAQNLVSITAPRGFFNEHGGLPRKITDLHAATSRGVGVVGPDDGEIISVGDNTDEAGFGTYVTDSPNGCLPALR